MTTWADNDVRQNPAWRATLRRNQIRLGPLVLADDFEDRVIKYYKSQRDLEKPLLVDFHDAEYVDVAALPNVIAFFLARCSQGFPTYIGTSNSKAVRDFLSLWRFPEAFKAATGCSLASSLVVEDRPYINEEQTTFTGSGGGIDALENDPDWREGFPGRRNFFEFSTYNIVTDATTQVVKKSSTSPGVSVGAVARIEGAHWNSQLIQAVLNRHITGDNPKDDVARVVIYEAMSNAVRHPGAHVIQAVSRFEKSHAEANGKGAGFTSTPRGGHLRICIWDDGKGIVETLKPVVQNGQPIRSMRMPSYMYDTIAMQVRQFGERSFSPVEIVDQEIDPAPDAPDHLFLIASTFPGVSRAVACHVDNVDEFDITNTSTDGNRTNRIKVGAGMGLYALMRTVLDVYRGTLVIRSGYHLMQLEPSHDAYSAMYHTRYKAKITVMPKFSPRFRGNLLTVHIPLR